MDKEYIFRQGQWEIVNGFLRGTSEKVSKESLIEGFCNGFANDGWRVASLNDERLGHPAVVSVGILFERDFIPSQN